MALFFALGGTAIAAHHYLITSTSQIKPSVLTKLRGSSGKNGSTGPQGKEGSTGPQGIPGKEGSQGVAGTLSSAYLDAYDESATTEVAVGKPIPFVTQVEPSVGISANAEGTAFTPTSTGTYLVTVSFPGGIPQGFKLEVGGAPAGPSEGSSSTTAISRAIQVTAGSAISVVNPSASFGEKAPADSEITIVRIA